MPNPPAPGAKLALGPLPLVKNRPPLPPLAVTWAAAVVGAVVRPTANATPAVATSTATPRATLRIDTPPDLAGGLTGAGTSVGPALTAGGGTARRLDRRAGAKVGTGWSGGTGSVGDPSAEGLLGSKGVVIEGFSYS